MKNLYKTLKPIVCGKISNTKDNIASCHSHNSIEIQYVLKGSISFRYEHQGQEKYLTLEENQLCVLFPDTVHQETFLTDCEYLLLELEYHENPTNLLKLLEDFATVNDLPVKKLLSRNNSVLSFSNANTCKKTFLNLIDILHQHLHNTPDDFFALRYELLIKQFFLEICELPTNAKSFTQTNLHINGAISFIKQNYHTNISLKDIASHVNVSEGYINRLFKAELNATPAAYLSDYRLHKAATLLKQSPLSIAQIYSAVGFRNIRTFEIAFLSKYKISPNEYRKNNSTPKFAFETSYTDHSITNLREYEN